MTDGLQLDLKRLRIDLDVSRNGPLADELAITHYPHPRDGCKVFEGPGGHPAGHLCRARKSEQGEDRRRDVVHRHLVSLAGGADVLTVSDEDARVAVIRERGASVGHGMRPRLAPSETVARKDDYGSLGREDVHPLSDHPIDLRVIVRHGGPVLAVALLAHAVAVGWVVGREEVVDGVGAVVGHHRQKRLLLVVQVDRHAVVRPGLCQDAAEDVDGIGCVAARCRIVELRGGDVQKTAKVLIADSIDRHRQRLSASCQRRRVDSRGKLRAGRIEEHARFRRRWPGRPPVDGLCGPSERVGDVPERRCPAAVGVDR